MTATRTARAPLAQRLADKLENLPNTPGVYLMKDARGCVFYVGKAKKLRDRIRSYAMGNDTRRFVALIDALLEDLEVVLVHSEKEALLLENELIKAHRPRFNVKLTDDKRFLCLRLDVTQRYPRLQVVRRFAKDGARYFGPYHSATAIREALRFINRHFQLRTCTDQVMANRARPCLQYQIKRCPAPCVFDLAEGGTYAANVTDVTAFLEGRQNELIEKLTERMHKHAENLQFEAAGALRDQIKAISRSLERQRMVTSDFINRDVVGLYRQGPEVEIHVMRTRGGRLIDARRFSFAQTEQETADVLADFATRYYAEEAQATDTPDEILFPAMMEWNEALSALLAERAGKVVRVLVPERGDKRRLVELADKNAQQAFVDKERERGAAKDSLERLQRALRLKNLPKRIECVDISHMMGKHIVASIVHLRDGAPDKAHYRRYKIRTLDNQDDFKSMYEVLSRRCARGITDGDLPELFVIDGGKGQLSAAHAALRDHGVTDVDLISLAKARNLDEGAAPIEAANLEGSATAGSRAAAESAATAGARASAQPPTTAGTDVSDGPADPTDAAFPTSPQATSGPRSPERVFVLDHKNPVVLRQNSAELFLLVRARDEAHRFAITYHRKLRQKAATRSVLDDIPGVGPKRRRDLLRHFGSVAQVQQASLTGLEEVVGKKLGAIIYESLQTRS